MRLLGMTASRFLRDHWQRKPLLVRGAVTDFADPRTPEELAGLACEDGVESRLVQGRGKRWSVAWGPHDESVFPALPEERWTLLVQELNRHVPEAAALLDRFAFIPNVRVDDVMVSYAAPGGGVGAHVDSYDVFLVQGMGERRWRFHTKPTKDVTFVKGLDLRILERFVPDEDVIVGPGDLLYVPPGFAHEGTAVTPCLTYSVGFRAPSAGEMWKAFAASRSGGEALLVDPPMTPARNPGEIPKALLAKVRAAVRGMIGRDEAIDRWFAAFGTLIAPGVGPTAPRRAIDPLPPLARGDAVIRGEDGRWAYLPRRGGGLWLYHAGIEIEVPRAAAELARTICASRVHAPRLRTRAEQELIVRLFAMGALRFAASARRRGS